MIFAPIAPSGATNDLCAGHMDQKDAGFGYASSGTDPKSIPACEGPSGDDNYAVTPNAAPHPDARKPLSPSTIDTGSYDETQDVVDPDGLQADRVLDSPLFTP